MSATDPDPPRAAADAPSAASEVPPAADAPASVDPRLSDGSPSSAAGSPVPAAAGRIETPRQATRTYRWIAAFTEWLLGVFFRQVRVSGVDQVPERGGGLVVAWHPNALLDPGLILTSFPGHIVFGARSGLFRVPLLGMLMRALGTVPLYRKKDARAHHRDEGRRSANRSSLDALARAVAEGSFSALFPEGDSHDHPDVQELKTGAASLYYRACELTPPGQPLPSILPVGLHYDEKGAFGSNALVSYHPPMEVPVELRGPLPPDLPPEERQERYRRLTAEIDRVLRETAYGLASWQLHHLMQRSRKLVRAERGARAGSTLDKPDMLERVLGFARFWEGYRRRLLTHPREVAELVSRVERYDEDLRALRLEDHELDGDPELGALWPSVLLGLQVVFVYLLLPPVLLIGYVVNLPTALLLRSVARRSSKAYKDEATVKLLLGAVAFPLTWLAVACLVAWGGTELAELYPRVPEAPVLTGVLAFLLSGVSGAVALFYLRLSHRTVRAVRVRFTRARRGRAVRRLRRERGEIFDRVMALAEGLELPGAVAADGRILPTAARSDEM